MTLDRPASPASEHPSGLLTDLISDALTPDVARQVRSHLNDCPTCTADLEAWRAVAQAVRDRASETVPSPTLADRIALRIQRESAARPTRPASLRWLAAVVAAQVPLVRSEVWPASAVIVGIGAVVSLLLNRASTPGGALALFAPIAAAIGIALIYGHENDPSLELALATPTPPQVVVVARLVVVLAWDLGLAFAASLALGLVHGPQVVAPLIGLWLGPMLLLGCLSLVLSLVIGITPALAVTGAIWGLRALELSAAGSAGALGGLGQLLDALWQTTPLTVGLAGAALALAMLFVSRADPPWAGAS